MTEETGRALRSGDEHDPPCEFFYHMENLPQLKVYMYAQDVTSGGGKFSEPDRTTAEVLGMSVASVIRGRFDLARDGWLVLTSHNRDHGGPNRYAFVSHAEWVKSHPGSCFQPTAPTT